MLRRCGKGAVRQPLVRLAASLGMERYGENPYRSYSSPALEFALLSSGLRFAPAIGVRAHSETIAPDRSLHCWKSESLSERASPRS